MKKALIIALAMATLLFAGIANAEEGAEVGATTTVTAIIDTQIAVSPNMSIIETGTYMLGESFDVTAAYTVSANCQDLKLCAIATDLWKAGRYVDGLLFTDPTGPIALVAADGATFGFENGSQQGTGLKSVNVPLPMTTLDNEVHELPGAKTDDVFVQSSDNGVWDNDTVTVQVSYDVGDEFKTKGEYIGKIKLIAMAIAPCPEDEESDTL